jgi:hypothetical protein
MKYLQQPSEFKNQDKYYI